MDLTAQLLRWSDLRDRPHVLESLPEESELALVRRFGVWIVGGSSRVPEWLGFLAELERLFGEHPAPFTPRRLEHVAARILALVLGWTEAWELAAVKWI